MLTYTIREQCPVPLPDIIIQAMKNNLLLSEALRQMDSIDHALISARGAHSSMSMSELVAAVRLEVALPEKFVIGDNDSAVVASPPTSAPQ